jgi:hypothetical protein
MFGIWWGFITAIRYTQMKLKSPFRSTTKQKKVSSRANTNTIGYTTSVTMPCICLPCAPLKRAPIESYLKIVLVSIALFLEIWTGFFWIDVRVPINGATTTTTTMAPMPVEEHHHDHNHEMSGRSVDSVLSAALGSGSSQLPQYKVIKKWDVEHGNQQHITMYSAFILGAVVEVMVHFGFDVPHKIEFVTGAMAFFIE